MSSAVATTTTTTTTTKPPISKICLTCKKDPPQPQRCGKCFKAYYCGKECQTADWARHKTECNKGIQLQASIDASGDISNATTTTNNNNNNNNNNANSNSNAKNTSAAAAEQDRIRKLEQTAAPQDKKFPAPTTFSGESLYSLFDTPVGDPKTIDFILYTLHLSKLSKSKETPADNSYYIPVPVIKSFPNSDYHNYPSLGISLCYEHNKLAAIHVYPDSTSGYDGYVGPLPHGISINDNNVAIVQRLKEPTIKGGQVVNVWIAYDNLGLQVDFTSRDWDDLNNKIACITLYKPKL